MANSSELKIRKALDHLVSVDQVMSGLIDEIGDCTLNRREDYYTSLVGSIINQQLSGSAADTIYRRFLSELGGELEPERVLSLSEEQFRRSGLSRAKQKFIVGLSEKFSSDSSFLRGVDALDDGEVLSRLTELKGIGRWTAEMFMIFSLNRLDVLPLGDAGFRRAVSRYYLDGEKPSDGDIERVSEKWRPYRTIAVWYLWRAVDGAPKGPIQN